MKASKRTQLIREQQRSGTGKVTAVMVSGGEYRDDRDNNKAEKCREEWKAIERNSAGLAACRCGSVNVFLLPLPYPRKGEDAYCQAKCPKCNRRGSGAPVETAIELWNADVKQDDYETGYVDGHHEATEAYLREHVPTVSLSLTEQIRLLARANAGLGVECRKQIAEVGRVTQERDELSEEMSACHHILDVELGEHEEGMVSIETLEKRLQDYFDDLRPIITDDDVNGDD